MQFIIVPLPKQQLMFIKPKRQYSYTLYRYGGEERGSVETIQTEK